MKVDGKNYKFFVTTNEYKVALISTECDNDTFFVPKKYDSAASATYKEVNDTISSLIPTSTHPVEVYDYQHRLLQEAYFRGTMGQEDFTMSLTEYNRKT